MSFLFLIYDFPHCLEEHFNDKFIFSLYFQAIEESMVLKNETLDIPLKKPKLTDAFLQEYQLQYMHNPMNRQLSAFRPWITKHQVRFRFL